VKTQAENLMSATPCMTKPSTILVIVDDACARGGGGPG
jgi:hypothetical protein